MAEDIFDEALRIGNARQPCMAERAGIAADEEMANQVERAITLNRPPNYRAVGRAAILAFLEDATLVERLARAIGLAEWYGEEPLPPPSETAIQETNKRLEHFAFHARAAIAAIRKHAQGESSSQDSRELAIQLRRTLELVGQLAENLAGPSDTESKDGK